MALEASWWLRANERSSASLAASPPILLNSFCRASQSLSSRDAILKKKKRLTLSLSQLHRLQCANGQSCCCCCCFGCDFPLSAPRTIRHVFIGISRMTDCLFRFFAEQQQPTKNRARAISSFVSVCVPGVPHTHARSHSTNQAIKAIKAKQAALCLCSGFLVCFLGEVHSWCQLQVCMCLSVCLLF